MGDKMLVDREALEVTAADDACSRGLLARTLRAVRDRARAALQGGG